MTPLTVETRGAPRPDDQVKGLGILTVWELRHGWIRLQENQQAHPVTPTGTDRLAHTRANPTADRHAFSH